MVPHDAVVRLLFTPTGLLANGAARLAPTKGARVRHVRRTGALKPRWSSLGFSSLAACCIRSGRHRPRPPTRAADGRSVRGDLRLPVRARRLSGTSRCPRASLLLGSPGLIRPCSGDRFVVVRDARALALRLCSSSHRARLPAEAVASRAGSFATGAGGRSCSSRCSPR